MLCQHSDDESANRIYGEGAGRKRDMRGTLDNPSSDITEDAANGTAKSNPDQHRGKLM
jgi:hypothetical protein